MHLPTIFAALLLPLAAIAEDLSTTTATSTLTLTKTLTLQRAAMSTGHNSTASFHPTTASTTLQPSASTTTPGQSITSPPNNAGSALGAAHVAAAAMAGVVVAAFL